MFIVDIYNETEVKLINKKQNINYIFVNTSDFYDKNLYKIGDYLIEIFSKIYLINKNIWKSRIFELNYSDPYFIELIQKKLIENTIIKYSISNIVFYGENKFNFNQSNLEITNDKIFQFFYAVKILLIRIKIRFVWLNNLIKYILVYILQLFNKKKEIISKKNLVLTSGFPSYWKNYGNMLTYRYLGVSKSLYADSNLFASMLHFNSINLRPYSSIIKNYFKNNNINLHLIEESTNLISVYKNFFSKNFNNIEKSQIIKILSSLGLKYQTFKIFDQINWIDLPKQNQLMNNTNIILNKINNSPKVIIPIYELSDGRCFTFVANKFKFKNFAIQHGSQGPWAYWRFIYTIKMLSKLNPNHNNSLYLLDGKKISEVFIANNIRNFEIIGSPRIRHLPLIYNSVIAKKNTFLIILDLHNWEKLLINLKLEIKSLLNFKIIIRPHPLVKNIVIEKINKINFVQNIFIDNFPNIDDSINTFSPCFILIGDSGFASELCLSGWPLILLRSRLLPTNSPLINKKFKIIKIYNIKEVVDLDIIDSKYKNHIYQLGNALIDQYGAEADNKLMQILNQK